MLNGVTDTLSRPSAKKSKRQPLPHPSPAERVQAGKVARAKVPRSTIAEFEPSTTRPDPVTLLAEQGASRVPELVPIRYGRMLVSPFTFFRGAALVMASDLATTPTSGLPVQACGDAHLSNFGVFASPDRALVFDVNDFDETLPGPWEWDVKRLAASLVVAGRERGFTAKQRAAVVTATGEAYRTCMATLAAQRNLDVWYQRADVGQLLTDLKPAKSADRKLAVGALAKARTRDSLQAFSKLTRVVDGEPRIISDPPLIVPVSELAPDVPATARTDALHQLLVTYRRSLQSDRRHLLEQFRLVDLARKVVGVGSVGTRCWIALFLGRDGTDPLFLQIKEAQASVLERFVGKCTYANQGERVVAGQRLMQAASDIFLGWIRTDDTIDGAARDFYVRQLRDWKGSADPDQMSPPGMTNYGRACGSTLARAHARSGDRIAIAAYLGKSAVFDQALAAFAELYADQNERDYQALQAAAESGRITVEAGL
ncbi:MAG: DUF2252 domain-containing protein [Acidimicrobiia bacterium]|nr:DUF2252 domain-containing protein [Acidimicrobiia bacterium]